MENEYPKRVAIKKEIHKAIVEKSKNSGMKIQAIVNNMLKKELDFEGDTKNGQ